MQRLVELDPSGVQARRRATRCTQRRAMLVPCRLQPAPHSGALLSYPLGGLADLGRQAGQTGRIPARVGRRSLRMRLLVVSMHISSAAACDVDAAAGIVLDAHPDWVAPAAEGKAIAHQQRDVRQLAICHVPLGRQQ